MAVVAFGQLGVGGRKGFFWPQVRSFESEDGAKKNNVLCCRRPTKNPSDASFQFEGENRGGWGLLLRSFSPNRMVLVSRRGMKRLRKDRSSDEEEKLTQHPKNVCCQTAGRKAVNKNGEKKSKSSSSFSVLA